MADKTKTIKNATDKELDELLVRLRKENETQDLIRNLQMKSTQNPNSPHPNFESYQGISTEVPIDTLYHKETDKVLEHFGIPGMHWGVRRQSGSSGRSSKKGEVAPEHTNARKLAAKGAKRLSNQELKDLTNRLQLEKSLRELKSSDKQKGLDFVKTATAMAGTMAGVYAIANSPAGKAATAAVKKAIESAVTKKAAAWVL